MGRHLTPTGSPDDERYRLECYLGGRVPGNDTTNLHVVILTGYGVIVNKWPYSRNAFYGNEAVLTTEHLTGGGSDSLLGRAVIRKPLRDYRRGDRLTLTLKHFDRDDDGYRLVDETTVVTQVELIGHAGSICR